MKKYFTILLLIPFLTLCTQNEEEEKECSAPTEKSQMAEASELSILMNDMFETNMKWKKQIENGEVPTGDYEKHSGIMTAQSVNERAGSDFYNAMAKTYLKNVKNITLSTPENVKKNFNTMVSTCISCHEEVCFGPIVRIKKLYIK